MKKITIQTTKDKLEFVGRYRRDLEKSNWHYYEDEKGNINKISHYRYY